jgi:hypothetical protein
VRYRTARIRTGLAIVVATELVLLLTAVGVLAARSAPGPVGPDGPDYIDIAAVPVQPADPVPLPGSSTGSYTWDCGHDENGHLNTANVVVTPGIPGPPHHLHEYVGNLSTDMSSTDASLAAAATSCANGDRSTYFWPVLRTVADPEHDRHEHGDVRIPASVTLTFTGNPAAQVLPMPRLMRAVTGDAYGATRHSPHVRPAWTCSGSLDRRTTRYPRCPAGDRVLRIFDFPSCWDGRRTDSPDHRAHLVFPGPDGACPRATFPVPRLRLTLGYDLPPGIRYEIDTFPEQQGNPMTDHSLLINLMPDTVMAEVVHCLNSGLPCSAATS